MVLADKRFPKKRGQLPKWINQALLESDTSLSTDMAVASAKKFLRTMAQPFGRRQQDGVSTWSIKDLMRHKEKSEREKIRELMAEEGEVGESSKGAMWRNGMNGVNGGPAGDDEYGDEEADVAMMDLVT